MRRLVRWTIVTVGVAALVRWLKRRREEATPSYVEPASDPADELRQKLAESRGDDAAAGAAPPETVAERRAEVHEQARTTLSEMAPDDEG